MKMETLSPYCLDDNKNTKKEELANLELNKLLQKKSKLSFYGSTSWKTFIFPPIPNLNSVFTETQQYFGLDLVEEESERTFWAHKASIWQNVFESVQEIAKTGQVDAISDIYNGILACPVRAVPKGPNDIKTFKSGKGQNIQHWIMLVPMPTDVDFSEYIADFISNFQALCQKTFIGSAYKSGVLAISQHTGLIQQISEEGNYWHVVDNAGQNDIIFQSKTCLSEVLLDCTIKEIVSLMFGVNKNQDTWPDLIKTYAYGI